MQRTFKPLLFSFTLLGLALAGLLVATPAAAQRASRPALAAAGAVYTMTNADDGNAVLAFRRSARGRLTFADAYATGGDGTGGGLGNQGGVVLNRSGSRLFAVNAGSDSVSVFAVAPRGLKLLSVTPSGGSRPVSVTTHGDLVYVLNAGGDGNIAGFELTPDGTLKALQGSIKPLSGSGTGPAQIAFSPEGHVLVVTEKATNNLVSYFVGDSGTPQGPFVTPSEGITPFGFSFGQRGRLFVSEAFGGAAQASAVSSYDVAKDASLTPITSSLPTFQSAACWLVLTGNGRYAYTTNTASDSVTGLAVARNGELELLDPTGYTAAAGDGPIDAALSRNSRYLYVLNGAEGSLSAYRVRGNGSLKQIPGIAGLPAGANGLAAE